MNYIFALFIVVGILFSLFTGREGDIVKTIVDATTDCSYFVLKLIFITAFFSGVIKVAEDSGMISKLSFLIKKVISKIFSSKKKETLDKMTLNISANILGIGNAATPLGLFAMKELDIENNHKDKPSLDMCKFIIFNSCSVQLIPTTILGLRQVANSANPTAIILPVIITSFISLTFGLILVSFLYKRTYANRKNYK
jgi:spore maturation protein A